MSVRDIASDPVARFWYVAAFLASTAPDHGSHGLYERLKAMYVGRFPEATPAEYEAAMVRVARMAGF